MQCFTNVHPRIFLQMKSLKKTGKLKQIVNFELNSVGFFLLFAFYRDKIFQTLFRDKGVKTRLDEMKTGKRLHFFFFQGGLSYGTRIQLCARTVHAAAARA